MRDFMAGPETPIARRPRLAPPTAKDGPPLLLRLVQATVSLLGIWGILHVVLPPGLADGVGTTPFNLPGLPGLSSRFGFPVAGISDTSLRGQVTVVNVFATWCGPCRDEHPVLLDLASRGSVHLVGLLSGDQAENGTQYLREHGNPFAAVAADSIGLARRLGVTGYPTTVVLDREGKVVASLRGGLDAGRIDGVLIPAVRKALDH